MLAVKQGLLGFVQLINPNPTMKYRLTSTSVKTLTWERPLIPPVNAVAVAVAVSMNTGKAGKTSFGLFLLLKLVDFCSRIEMVVAL